MRMINKRRGTRLIRALRTRIRMGRSMIQVIRLWIARWELRLTSRSRRGPPLRSLRLNSPLPELYLNPRDILRFNYYIIDLCTREFFYQSVSSWFYYKCILSTGLCVSMYLCFKLCIRGLAVRVLLNTVLDINASVIQAGFYVMGM